MLRTIFVLITILVSVPVYAVSLVPGLPDTWGNSNSGGFWRTGDATPIVYVVDSLAWDTTALQDDTRNGYPVKTGNLRAALKAHESSGKKGIIIFERSGTINGTAEFFRCDGNNNGLSVLGETAPSPGITIRGVTICTKTLSSRLNNAFFSHLRFRAGHVYTGNPDYWTAFRNGSSKAFFRNCSFSWGIDINFGGGSDIDEITLYRCFITEPLHDSAHSKGPHGKGASASVGTTRAWYIENLFAHCPDRNPYLQGGTKMIANNLVYNWEIIPTGVEWSSTPPVYANIVGNYYIEGLDTPDSADDYVVKVWGATNLSSRLYVADNRLKKLGVAAYTQTSSSDWSIVNASTTYRTTTPRTDCTPTGYTAMAVADVYDHVLENAGARPIDRDSVDQRAVSNVTNLTRPVVGFVDNEQDVGGWPSLAVNTVSYNSTMPNPGVDTDEDGYSDFEEWTNAMAAALLPGEGGLPVSTVITNVTTSTAKEAIAYNGFIQPGATVYFDRSHQLVSVGAAYQGLDGIKGFCDDKVESAGSTYYTFDLSDNGTLYAPWDDRYSPAAWLSTWTDTTDNMIVNDGVSDITLSIYSKSVSSGSNTINGAGINGLQYIVFFDPTGGAPTGETITDVSAPATTYTLGQTVPLTITWSNTPTLTGTMGAYLETGYNDLYFSCSTATSCTSSPISQGMRTTNLDFKSLVLTLDGSSTLKYSGVDAELDLPADITNTTVIAEEGIFSIPSQIASFSVMMGQLGYLLPGDTIYITTSHSENISFTDSGSSGNPITIDLASGSITGTMQVDGDYVEIKSTGPCSYITGVMTLNGDNITVSNIDLIENPVDNGAGNSITECSELIPRGNYKSDGPKAKHRPSQGMNLKHE